MNIDFLFNLIKLKQAYMCSPGTYYEWKIFKVLFEVKRQRRRKVKVIFAQDESMGIYLYHLYPS